MVSKSRSYRIAVGLFTAILLISLSGTVLADKSLCACCGGMNELGHMQSESVADCCNTPACDHCAIDSSPLPTPVAAISSAGNTARQNTAPFFITQAVAPNDLSAYWNNTPKNNTPLDVLTKIPIYLHLQIIRC